MSMDFDATDQLLIIYSAFVNYARIDAKICDSHFFSFLKKAYDSVRRKVLYNILIEFGIPVKLVRLI